METKTNVMRILDAHHVPYKSYSYVGTGATSGDAVAAAVGEKSIDMLKSRDLLGLTGYIHGGCSPIGMKKQFKTIADASAQNFATIIFSAGRIGYQVEMSPNDIEKIIPLAFFDLCAPQN